MQGGDGGSDENSSLTSEAWAIGVWGAMGAKGSTPQVGKFCESPSQSVAWKSFSPYQKSIKSNGQNGKDKRYYTWDHTRGDIEVFNRNGNHLGSMHPSTGVMHKPPVAGRTLEGF